LRKRLDLVESVVELPVRREDPEARVVHDVRDEDLAEGSLEGSSVGFDGVGGGAR
jgi:hypothetical protein